MGTYISSASVRRTVGIDSDEINNTDVDATITEVEKQVPRRFNTVFAPTERIDILNGDGTNRLLLDKNPLLSVRQLKIDGTTEDPANLEIYKESGYIFLGSGADTSKFTYGNNKIVVKYLHGSVIHSDSANTTTSDDEVAGTSVTVAVTSSASFAQDDWIEIYGMDGNREAAQIDSIPDGTSIVLDQLIQTHESGSTVVKLEIDENFKKLMNIVVGIAMVARIIGQSYDENTGYELGELRIQKGEPYTQWKETANQLIKERDSLMSSIINRPYTI